MTVYVPPDVFDGLEHIRMSGKTNMYDFNTVHTMSMELGFHATTHWLGENKDEYLKGISLGIEPDDDLSGTDCRVDG